MDYITSLGYIDGPEGRRQVGFRPGGPVKVITDLAVLGFDDRTLRMRLLSVHPNVSVEDVEKNTGFDLIIPKKVPVSPAPIIKEQEIIRTTADATGVYTGWKR